MISATIDTAISFSVPAPMSGLVGVCCVAAMLGGPADGSDDVLVTGTPADLPRYRRPDLGFGGIRVVVEQPAGRHHHAGGAESALQAVALEALDGAHGVPVGHRR